MLELLALAGYRLVVSFGIGYSLLVASYDRIQRWRGGKPFPEITGTIQDGAPTPAGQLDLEPGEWVEVKSKDEIARTLTKSGFNRGMRYDLEMLQYSGNRYRVQRRVDKIINEKNGKMSRMKTAAIQLEDVYCRATCTEQRLGCPRASNTYWREIWLKRAGSENSTEGR